MSVAPHAVWFIVWVVAIIVYPVDSSVGIVCRHTAMAMS